MFLILFIIVAAAMVLFATFAGAAFITGAVFETVKEVKGTARR